ncbi:MAG: UDP-glucose 4-epimerase [Kiritimatiellia bacterium]|jgi:UDP-glucose 4-epimerase
MVKEFEKQSGKAVPYKIVPRREGDEADFDLKEMCRDSWKWQSTNPDGY